MWSWFKASYIIPKYQHVLGKETYLIYEASDHYQILTGNVSIFERQCRELKVLSEGGLTPLCVFCKNCVAQYVGNTDACEKFIYNGKASDFYTDDTIKLRRGMEFPIHLLISNPFDNTLYNKGLRTNPKVEIKFSFNRIKNNMELLLNNRDKFYSQKDIDIEIQWFVTKRFIVSEDPNISRQYIAKIAKLYKSFKNLTYKEFNDGIKNGTI
ncbi:MAG: hypothetical protein KKE17_15650 [Proteobacteria bacterium]|nr:hypothetical protein [Pseudomonadota bacterium]